MESRDLAQHVLEFLKQLLVTLGLLKRSKRVEVGEIPDGDRQQLGGSVELHGA